MKMGTLRGFGKAALESDETEQFLRTILSD